MFATQSSETGLFGDLNELTDCSLGPSSPIPGASPFPSPARKPSRRNPKSKKIMLGVPDAKHTSEGFESVQSMNFHLSEARRCRTGFRGRPNCLDESRVKVKKGTSPEQHLLLLENAGYQMVKLKSHPVLILDSGGTCIGIAVPPCQNTKLTEEMGKELRNLFPLGQRPQDSKRGDFEILQYGIQMGHGTTIPGPRNQSPFKSEAISSFLQNSSVKAVLHRVNRKHSVFTEKKDYKSTIDVFMKYFPEQHGYYKQTLETICALSTSCELPTTGVPFSSYTLNVGRQCVCNSHVDGSNLITGLCLAIPFGTFNHTKGGHLILHELRMVLELPEGSIVLFPSAFITHENVGVGENEERQSFTAFTPASIFQWVEDSFGRVPKFKNEKEKKEYGDKHWDDGKSRFPHIYKFL